MQFKIVTKILDNSLEPSFHFALKKLASTNAVFVYFTLMSSGGSRMKLHSSDELAVHLPPPCLSRGIRQYWRQMPLRPGPK